MRFPAFFRSGLLLSFASAALFLGSCQTPPAPVAATNDLAWPLVGREQKPWTRWWWLGNAVDRENLTRELTDFAAHGLGGVEVTPVYGAKGYESRFIDFLSPNYVAMLGYTASEAHRLGLGVDMATTTGWPFGGPWVGPSDVEQKLVITNGQLTPRPTGFQVKRSAPGGHGPVVNPFSTGAVSRYLEPFTQALSALPPGSIHGQFQDSYEFTASWATEVPHKFLAMHGYDLRDHLAEMTGKGDPDAIARVKSDYRETLAQLHLDYVRTWVDWSHRTGSLAREQAHGAPGNLLDIYAASDVPETEIFGSTPFPIPLYRDLPAEIGVNVPPPLVNRMASSAAHVAGRPLTSSETFTWLRDHFHSALSEAKPELDQLYLTGINRIYYQGTAYSPSDAPWPGWLFYASIQENSRNSLWDEFAWLNAYIGRCDALLQAGVPDNDLLVYWPVYDLWHDSAGLVKQFAVHNAKVWMDAMPCGALASELVAGGYTFDYISDAQLDQAQAAHGGLTVPGGTYRAVVVPRTAHMPLATLERLLALAADGATVIFIDALPADVPGYGQLEERRSQFKADLAKLNLQDTGVVGPALRPSGPAAACSSGPTAAWSPRWAPPANRSPTRDSASSGAARATVKSTSSPISPARRSTAGPRLGRAAARGAVLLEARSGKTGGRRPAPGAAERRKFTCSSSPATPSS